MKHVQVVWRSDRPPVRPIRVYRVIYDHWLNVRTGLMCSWDGFNWQKVETIHGQEAYHTSQDTPET